MTALHTIISNEKEMTRMETSKKEVVKRLKFPSRSSLLLIGNMGVEHEMKVTGNLPQTNLHTASHTSFPSRGRVEVVWGGGSRTLISWKIGEEDKKTVFL